MKLRRRARREREERKRTGEERPGGKVEQFKPFTEPPVCPSRVDRYSANDLEMFSQREQADPCSPSPGHLPGLLSCGHQTSRHILFVESFTNRNLLSDPEKSTGQSACNFAVSSESQSVSPSICLWTSSSSFLLQWRW